MADSVFSGCTEACGWTAAVIAIVAWGSFGVPIRSIKSNNDVHPLVLQSMKTTVCFLTCPLAILLGEELRFSYYGIISGLFWVPGAACGIYGIRNAGLAVAVGTWSSIIVMSSFLFGIVIFQEQVKSFFVTLLAFCTLTAGLVGMAKYSGHKREPETKAREPIETELAVISSQARAIKRQGSHGQDESHNSSMQAQEMEPLFEDDEDFIMGGDHDGKVRASKDRILFPFGFVLTRRQTGLLGAVINGAWGGMNLVPLHFAMQNEGLSGAGYLISYATGSFIVNTAIWIAFFLFYLHKTGGNFGASVDLLPKWHLDQLLLPGLIAGLLYSIGNFSSIIAVTYLGQGTGFSFCQMQLLVSGLWGVFYFREIKGKETITKWFASAAVAVVGIVALSYEHEGGSAH